MIFKELKRVVFTLLSIVCHKNTKFLFCVPKKAEVLILDPVDESRIKAALLGGVNYATLDTRYGHEKLKFRIYLSPKIIYFSLCMLIKGRHPWTSYCYAIIRCISPKVVIDNMHLPFMLPLAQEMPNIRFFVISNGFWNDVLDRVVIKSFYTYSLKAMFQRCPQRVSNFHVFNFGKKDSDLFRQCGLDERSTGIHYHDVGSLFGDYMRAMMRGSVNVNDYDIVFVSQCDGDAITGSQEIQKKLVENTRLAISNLNKYIVEKNKRCLILLRGQPKLERSEIAFYQSLFDESAQVEFHRNDNLFAVYEGLTRAPVIISLFSTTGFEAMSWGKKVLFCLYGFTKIYKISSDKYETDTEMLKWSLETAEYSTFQKKLDDLFKMKMSDYLSQNAEVVDYIISGRSEKPAHIYIRDVILSELGQAPLH
ncbi:MAG: hypothetical protein ABFD51_13310 [Anaerolineaceae bacterium]|nr:hypothetical protein [Betaproteobacteria bacterium]